MTYLSTGYFFFFLWTGAESSKRRVEATRWNVTNIKFCIGRLPASFAIVFSGRRFGAVGRFGSESRRAFHYANFCSEKKKNRRQALEFQMEPQQHAPNWRRKTFGQTFCLLIGLRCLFFYWRKWLATFYGFNQTLLHTQTEPKVRVPCSTWFIWFQNPWEFYSIFWCGPNIFELDIETVWAWVINM